MHISNCKERCQVSGGGVQRVLEGRAQRLASWWASITRAHQGVSATTLTRPVAHPGAGRQAGRRHPWLRL
jgi:hypothetical protein